MSDRRRPGLAERAWLLGVAAHRGLYASGVLPTQRLPATTLAVGALRAGGSGKSPISLLLARSAAHRGADVLVLARGHGRASHRPALAFDSASTPPTDPHTLADLAATAGDEAAEVGLQLASGPAMPGRLRWAVGRDRLAAFEAVASALRPDLVVLDDGWSHWRLRHDALVVVLAESDRIARVLPAGPLRLPPDAIPPTALVWHHGPIPPRPTDALASSWITRDAADAAGRGVSLAALGPALLICATGTPDRVARCARHDGLDLRGAITRPDHHRWTAPEAAALAARARAANLAPVTTAKDWVKLAALWPPGPPLRWLRGDVRIDHGAAAMERLLDTLLGAPA